MSEGDRSATLREIVAEQIRLMIVRGQLQQGERLYEDRLADQLAVSRNPVREAIRALEATGLVEVQARRGTFVSTIDPMQIRQLLELRTVIEAYSAQQAALHRNDAEIALLLTLVDEGRSAAMNDDQVAAAAHHRQFHITIDRASRNDHLEAVVAPIRNKTELVFSMLANVRGVVAWDEHERILDAIIRGDANDARDCTYEHMASVMRSLDAAATVV